MYNACPEGPMYDMTPEGLTTYATYAPSLPISTVESMLYVHAVVIHDRCPLPAWPSQNVHRLSASRERRFMPEPHLPSVSHCRVSTLKVAPSGHCLTSPKAPAMTRHHRQTHVHEYPFRQSPTLAQMMKATERHTHTHKRERERDIHIHIQTHMHMHTHRQAHTHIDIHAMLNVPVKPDSQTMNLSHAQGSGNNPLPSPFATQKASTSAKHSDPGAGGWLPGV